MPLVEELTREFITPFRAQGETKNLTNRTKKSGRKATHVEFKVTKKCTIKPEQPEQPEQKIKAIDIYKAISSNNLLPRFLEFSETSEELINRIKDDLKNNNSERWINKLAEFNINIDAP